MREDHDQHGNLFCWRQEGNHEVGCILNWASPEVRADKPTVLLAFECFGTDVHGSHSGKHPFPQVGENLHADPEVVLAAFRSSCDVVRVLQLASADLRGDTAIVTAALHAAQRRRPRDQDTAGEILALASDEIRRSRDMVQLAITSGNGRNIRNRNPLEVASTELRADRDIVMQAVARWGGALESAATKLQADREVVEAAVRWNGNALRWASQSIIGDKSFVRWAINSGFNMFQMLPERLRKDESIGKAAVRRSISYLHSLHPSMKSNREVMSAAINKQRKAINFASPELRGDRDIQATWANATPAKRRALREVNAKKKRAKLRKASKVSNTTSLVRGLASLPKSLFVGQKSKTVNN
jgi:hypothetical protein